MSFSALCPLMKSLRLDYQADCTSTAPPLHMLQPNTCIHVRSPGSRVVNSLSCCSKVVPSAGSNATFPTGVQAAAEGLPAGPALIKPPLTIAPTLALSPAPSKISAQPAPKGSSKPLAMRSQPPFPQPPRSQPPQASAGQPLPTLAQPGAGQPLASQPGRAPGPVPTVPGALLHLIHPLRNTDSPI